MLDGVFYRARPDCTLERPSAQEKSPFAALVFFKPQHTDTLAGQPTLGDISRALETKLPSPRVFAAVRLHGRFQALTIRSVPAFQPPYPTLAKALGQQQTRQMQDVSGTLVGIYCPPQSGTLAVPGWHFHFKQDNADVGGHVLAASLDNGQAQVMVLSPARPARTLGSRS